MVLKQLLLKLKARLGQHGLPPLVVHSEKLLNLPRYSRCLGLVRVVVQRLEQGRCQLLVVDEGLLDIRRPAFGEPAAGRSPPEPHACLPADHAHVLILKRRRLRLTALGRRPQALLSVQPLAKGVLWDHYVCGGVVLPHVAAGVLLQVGVGLEQHGVLLEADPAVSLPGGRRVVALPVCGHFSLLVSDVVLRELKALGLAPLRRVLGGEVVVGIVCARNGDLEALVLVAAVADLKVEEAAVVLEFLFLLAELG